MAWIERLRNLIPEESDKKANHAAQNRIINVQRKSHFCDK